MFLFSRAFNTVRTDRPLSANLNILLVKSFYQQRSEKLEILRQEFILLNLFSLRVFINQCIYKDTTMSNDLNAGSSAQPEASPQPSLDQVKHALLLQQPPRKKNMRSLCKFL